MLKDLFAKYSERPRTGRPVWQTGQNCVRLSNFRFSDVRFYNRPVFGIHSIRCREPDVRLYKWHKKLQPNVRKPDINVQFSDNVWKLDSLTTGHISKTQKTGHPVFGHSLYIHYFWTAHEPESFPQWRRRETFDTGHQPNLIQDAQDSLAKLVTNVIWKINVSPLAKFASIDKNTVNVRNPNVRISDDA